MTPRERSTVANHFGKLQQYVEDDVDDPDSSPASKGIKIGSVAGRKLVMDGHPEVGTMRTSRCLTSSHPDAEMMLSSGPKTMFD